MLTAFGDVTCGATDGRGVWLHLPFCALEENGRIRAWEWPDRLWRSYVNVLHTVQLEVRMLRDSAKPNFVFSWGLRVWEKQREHCPRICPEGLKKTPKIAAISGYVDFQDKKRQDNDRERNL